MLGICVGLQVLFEHGVEHGDDAAGLGEWPGVVERLQAPVVPHMGWNTVDVPAGSRLFAGVEDERFYFVHSYGVRSWELETKGRTRLRLLIAALVLVQVVVWIFRDDWPARLAALAITLLLLLSLIHI